jgi:hypothetical protein
MQKKDFKRFNLKRYFITVFVMNLFFLVFNHNETNAILVILIWSLIVFLNHLMLYMGLTLVLGKNSQLAQGRINHQLKGTLRLFSHRINKLKKNGHTLKLSIKWPNNISKRDKYSAKSLIQKSSLKSRGKRVIRNIQIISTEHNLQRKLNWQWILVLFSGKLIILIVGIFICARIAPDKMFLVIAIYLLQIFIFILSVKKA